MRNVDSVLVKPIPSLEKSWSWDEVKSMPICENQEPLVSLHYFPEKIITSPQYYIQNIDGAIPECLARSRVQTLLLKASKLLPLGYKFVIFDSWRPLKVQQSLFNMLKDEIQSKFPDDCNDAIISRTLTYVALPSKDPAKPSPHNTGGAIDLSIVDPNGCLLNMGTPFDDPSLASATAYYETLIKEGQPLTEAQLEALNNRRLLYNVMTSVGFTNYPDEYWHYDYGNQNWAWMSSADHALYSMTSPTFPWNKNLD